MILLELFKSKADISVDDLNIQTTSDSYEMKIALGDSRDLKIYCKEKFPKVWDLSFTVGGRQDVSGGGSELEVFSIVTTALKQFDKDKQPEMIYMTSKAANRTKLYIRMLGRALPGWRLVGMNDAVGEGDHSTLIVASRNDFKVMRDNKGVEFIRIGPTRIRVGGKPDKTLPNIKDVIDSKRVVFGDLKKELAQATE